MALRPPRPDRPVTDLSFERINRRPSPAVADAPVPAAVFGPPGAGADLAANQPHPVRTYPANQPAGDEPQGRSGEEVTMAVRVLLRLVYAARICRTAELWRASAGEAWLGRW